MNNLKQALDSMEVATPETIQGIQGVFVAPATLDDILAVFEAASDHLTCQLEKATDDKIFDSLRGVDLSQCTKCLTERNHPWHDNGEWNEDYT